MTAQTSEHGGLIYGLYSEMDGSGEPISTAVTRDFVVNGLLHTLDSSGRLIVNFPVVSATQVQLTSPPTTDPSLVPGMDFAFPLAVRYGDSSSFRYVVRLRASISAAGTATYRLVLRYADRLRNTRPADPATLTTNAIVEVSTTSTTGEELSATLYMSAAAISRAPYAIAPSEDGTGDPTSVFYIPATIQVWAKSSSGSSNPRVLGLTVREYPGTR